MVAIKLRKQGKCIYKVNLVTQCAVCTRCFGLVSCTAYRPAIHTGRCQIQFGCYVFFGCSVHLNDIVYASRASPSARRNKNTEFPGTKEEKNKITYDETYHLT